MGVLDGLLGKITGGAGSGTEGQIAGAVIGILSNKNSGGLSGLVEGLTKSGLGDVVSSWIGTGANLPISPDQVATGLGADRINQIASKVELTPEVVSAALANVLPGIVDKLTPNGKIPTGDLFQQGLSLLEGKF